MVVPQLHSARELQIMSLFIHHLFLKLIFFMNRAAIKIGGRNILPPDAEY